MTPSIVEQFKSLYLELNRENCSKELISTVYADDICFVDPFHSINSIDSFTSYCTEMYQNLEACDFVFLDEVTQENKAFLHWQLTYQHPRLNKGKPITVPGMSLIKFDEKVHFHQDCFDAGLMIYENIPLIGSLIGSIKKRVG